MNSFLNENNINEIIISIQSIHNMNNSSKDNIQYLSQKRKRNLENTKDIVSLKEKVKKKIKDNKLNLKIEGKDENKKKEEYTTTTLKLQNLSKNIFSIISSYLRIDDLLKLKNIGSHNIRLYIIDLFKLMKNENYFIINENESIKAPYMNEFDSLLCKKYFLMNKYLNTNIIVKNNLNVKYILYHEQTNKIYFIIHHMFHNYFCFSEKDIKNICMNYKNILFRLPDKDYYEKFQFLDEFKISEVAIFSLNKILLYNISTKKKDYSIYLNSSCDYVLYKKEIKLLIVPNSSGKEIEFFKINFSKKNILDASYNLIIGKDNIESKCDILNFRDYIKDYIFENLICIYCIGSKDIIIYDCKLMKKEKKIITNSNIIKIFINKLFLIVYTKDKYLNYYSLNNKEYILTNSFNLKNICPLDNIKYISLINSHLLNNIFILLVQIPNKKVIKPFILYVEQTTDKNNNYFSYVSLGNNIQDSISDENLLIPTLSIEKINNYNSMKLKLVLCYLDKKSSLNQSYDNIRIKNNDKRKEEYLIEEYSVKI